MKTGMALKKVFTLIGISLLLGAACFGQTGTGNVQIKGEVLDPNSAPIVGANVTVTSDDGASHFSALTGSDGAFSFILSPKKFTISITSNGFAEVTKTLDLTHVSLAPVEISMPVAGANASVNVVNISEYSVPDVTSALKTPTVLRDIPQSIAVVTKEQISDQLLTSIGDILRYTPGVTVHQGENNRDEAIIRGQDTSSSFYLNGVRDDVQYYRDPYNLERLETLKGPNAMIFGRGGGGGVINRVTKDAIFSPIAQIEIQGGSFYNRRVSGDLDRALSDKMAFRLNGVYENSDSFRKYVNLQRVAINPTFTIKSGQNTTFTVSYEFARDRRVADRGITSFNLRPAKVPIDTYYGDPKNSFVRSNVNLVSGTFDHQIGNLMIHNRTTYGYYDRMYQNYVPGAANATATLVTLTGYNNATKRRNFFNQTDLTYLFSTGSIKHTVVGGAEFGNQASDNFRNTLFFNNATTLILVPFSDPTTTVPVTFRQSATDANNHVVVKLAASYIQDQIDLNRFLKIVGGVRYDYFDLHYHNNRDGSNFGRIDDLVSPRFGLIVKPVEKVSIYGNYSVSYLPSSGDQFSSLTIITAQAKPEKFTNYEVGVKWDIRHNLSFTSALYRLNRTNTRATDPNNPTAIIQTGSERTNGFEVGFNGFLMPKWTISGGYSYQDAFITSATTAAVAGKQVGQTPHNTFTVWNKYQLLSKLSVGLGIINRSDMFVAVDNTVVLPGFTRADAAVFYSFNEHWRLQGNIENLFNKKYIINADSNTNLSPGSSRALRIGLVARF